MQELINEDTFDLSSLFILSRNPHADEDYEMWKKEILDENPNWFRRFKNYWNSIVYDFNEGMKEYQKIQENMLCRRYKE